MISQTYAIFLDTFRYLRSRYLFWIVLGISALAAMALFATYSFTPDGLKILWFKPIENPQLAQGTAGRDMFISGLFNGFYVKFWLGWGAMILALISTASLLPDFLSDGAIDLSLSKPISRWKLLMLKFLSGMLFVLIQLILAVGLAYLIIGIRFDLWIHAALLGIPLLTLQFFYLYSIAALISVYTRSTIATLLGTLIVWLVIFLAQFVSNSFIKQTYSTKELLNRTEERIVRYEGLAKERELTTREQSKLRKYTEDRDSQQSIYDFVQPWAKRSQSTILFVPKTGDLQKYLATKIKAPVSNEFFGLFMDISNEEFRPANMDKESMQDALEAESVADRAVRQISLKKSILSSLLACLVLLGIATRRFTKRDY